MFETAVHDSNKKSEDSLFNPTLLILPLLMVLPGWATVLYIMAEVVCHSWSHRGESDHRPLATPMQLMFHHKCAECVARRQMQKVTHYPCFVRKWLLENYKTVLSALLSKKGVSAFPRFFILKLFVQW